MTLIQELQAMAEGPEEERALFASLAETERHPTGMNLATEIMRGLVSTGTTPGVCPILRAKREALNADELSIDHDDPFNRTFLSMFGCESGISIEDSVVAYLGGCSVRLEAITRVDSFTEQELQRLDPVPLPALRVVFEPIEI